MKPKHILPICLFVFSFMYVCAQTVRINEVVASNQSTLADEDGDFEDWIELYNYGVDPVDLGGWGLSDNPSSPFKWTFPEGTTLGPGDYMLVWASGKDRIPLSTVNPQDFSPAVWLHADHVETRQENGTHYVTSWLDASGNGHHASQSDPSRQPVWIEGENGESSKVVFNQSMLDFQGDALSLFQNVGYGGAFMVLEANDINTFSIVLVFTTGTGAAQRFGINISNGEIRVAGRKQDADVFDYLGHNINPFLGPRVYTSEVNWQSRELRIWEERFLRQERTNFQSSGKTTDITSNIGRLGASGATTSFFDGSMREILLFNQPLTWQERDILQRYLTYRHRGHPDNHFHTNFAVSAGSEPVLLTTPEGDLVDEMPVMPLPRNVSLGRDPDDPDSWVYFQNPTPLAANTTEPAEQLTAPPTFSHAGGFHTADVPLELSHPDPEVTILYTLDGSVPDPANLDGKTYMYKNRYPRDSGDLDPGPELFRTMWSHEYTEPLTIANRASDPYELAAINTQFTTSTTIPRGNPFKSTVVRARAFRPGGLPSPIITHTYFVHPTMPDRYQIPVLSVTIPEKGLFDYFTGIYTPGNIGTQWRLDNPNENRTGGSPANFRERGGQWEKWGHFEMFSPEGNPMLSQKTGFRIHGGWSRAHRLKSLRLYPRPYDDGPSDFAGDIFEGLTRNADPTEPLTSFRRLMIRNSGNDWSQTYYRDAFMQELVAPLGLDSQAYQPAVHFVNGEFWGMINIRERQDAHYIHAHYGIDPEDVVILTGENTRVDTGTPDDRTDFIRIIEYAEDHDLSDPVHFQWIQERVDTDNLMRFYAAQVYLNNQDWPQNNIDWWRKRTSAYDPGAPAGQDGRWRWLLYDTDQGFGDVGDANTNSLGRVVHLLPGSRHRARVVTAAVNRLFRPLVLKNEGFRNDFVNTLADGMNSYFQPDHVLDLIQSFSNCIAPHRTEHNDRWRVSLDQSNLDQFALDRPAAVRGHILSTFNLPGTANLQVKNQTPGEGLVRVNSLLVDAHLQGLSDPESPYPWSGVYFQEVPVTLHAHPESGHRFLGWRIDEQPEYASTEPTFELSLTSDTTVEAVFEEIPLSELPVALYVWDFEDENAPYDPALPVGGGPLVFVAGSHADSEAISNTGGDFDTRHLRVNFPLDSSLTFPMSTAGFEQITLEFLTRRSGQGAEQMVVAYTTNGVDWNTKTTLAIENEPPQPQSIDFSAIPGASDNPDFAVRFTFLQGDGGEEGNNRFDDVVLSGVGLPATNLPPVVQEEEIPGLLKAVAANSPDTLDFSSWFLDPEDDPLQYDADSSNESVLTVSVNGAELSLTPHQAGDAVVTVTADDGHNPPVPASFRILVYPAPHALDGQNYFFTEWSPYQPAGSFPPHMIFLQSDRPDPGVDAPLLHPYSIAGFEGDGDDPDFPYAATSRTRINGLGENGISFINTGRAEGRDLGSALLALDTREVSDISLAFTVQTLVVNSREYAIRLQHRSNPDAPWSDVMDGDDPVEYLRSTTAGHEETFELDLPSSFEGHANLQFQWRYYYISGSGSRPELRLDEVIVTSSGAPLVPTQLALEDLPPGVGAGPLPPLTIRVLDANGIPVTGFNGEITLSLDGDGTLSGTTSVQAVDGVAVFDDLILDGSGLFTLTASAAEIDSAQATTRALQLVDVLVPAYLQGEQDENNDNLNRIPVAFRFRIEGLAPGATYRHGNRMAHETSDPEADDNGAGNFILIPSDGTDWVRSTSAPRFRDTDLNSRHAELTADENGVWEGWVVTEPSGNARFTPENVLRPLLILNNGEGGEDPAWFLRADSEVTVLELGLDPEQGTAVYGQTANASARFVALYDDANSLLALTQVEARGSEFDDRYADFYLDTVAAHPGRWGTLIPNSLADGVARVDFLDAEGNVLETLNNGLEATGNAEGGTLALWLPAATDFVFLPGGDGRWDNANHWQAPGWPDGPGVSATVKAPLWEHRAITVPEDVQVTLGALTFSNGENRNRIDGPGSFTFDGDDGSAQIIVTDGGEGWAEFDLEGPVTLATALILITQSVETDPFEPEFGALRLRGTWQGPGGLTKTGPGVASLTGTDKNFEGHLIVEEGVLRITDPATPGQTAGVNVLDGGQIRLVSSGENRVYDFGVPLHLAGGGRNPDDVPEGDQRGILGALRFDPFANDNEAVLPGGVMLSGESSVSIHVDGTGNLLEIGGPLTGTVPFSKTGGGTLRLNGTSAMATNLDLANGTLRVDGDYPELAISVQADGVLTGTGTLGTAAGAGTIKLGPGEVLTAQSVSGLSYQFRLQIGTPAPILRLRDETPFVGGINAANHLALYLNQPPTAHPRFGFFSDSSANLRELTADGSWSVYLQDDDGPEEHLDEKYSLLTNTPNLFTAHHNLEDVEGTLLGAAIGPANYGDWAEVNFEPGEADGPTDDPFGTGPNLLNFALGLPAGVLPGPGDIFLGITENGWLYARFRRDPNLTHLIYVVEAVPDITDWTDPEILYDSNVNTEDNNDLDRMLIVDEAPETDTRFLRIRIETLPNNPNP
ncbi:MAG: CotH kinase family protein [Verrucomicrobia bacterium]|nr:CotH kinase family protein [Verrucomicrobiota bacterium]